MLVPPSFCLTKYETTNLNAWDFWCAYVDRECVQVYIEEARPIIYQELQSVDVIEKNRINIEKGGVTKTGGYESEKYVSDFRQIAYDHMNTAKNVDQSYTASHRYPTVNITAPDDILITSFMDWVSKERRKLGIIAPKNTALSSSGSKVMNLHASRVLQYMDVSQYHQIMNLLSGGDHQNKYGKTSDEEMVSIIFPDYTEGDFKERMKLPKKYLKKLRFDKKYRAAISARP